MMRWWASLTDEKSLVPEGWKKQSATRVAPSAGSLPPARLGRGAAELQAHDAQLEASAVHLYADALRHAQRVRDGESAALFARLLDEESQHLQRVQQTQGATHG